MPSVVSSGSVRQLMSEPAGAGLPVVDPGMPLLDYEPVFGLGGGDSPGASVQPLVVWASQPSVRKVVDFIARAIASTPLKVYERVSDTDRRRITEHPLARVLATPSVGVTPFRFWHSIVADWLIFDRWVAVKATSSAGGLARPVDLVRIQAWRTRFRSDGLGRVRVIDVDGEQVQLRPSQCIFDHGYSPRSANGTTPMATLGGMLAEYRESIEYRRALWKRGARVQSVIERPIDAPKWSDQAQDRFRRQWEAFAAGGGREGGTPVLQDGMKLASPTAFSPKETLDIEQRKLTDAEVASAYHIAPELVGARQGTYSNVEAYRQMLYRDGLGPYYVAWEQVLNAMLTPDLDPAGSLYIEADLDSKLRGSFEDQAKVAQMMVGGPSMTRNEFRARMNLPAIDGGDELIVPLNVVEGGQASPADSAPPPKAAARAKSGSVTVQRKDGQPSVKAAPRDEHEKAYVDAFGSFFRRQRKSVLSALGSKAAGDVPDWWDSERWDSELAALLFALSQKVIDEVAADVLAGLDLPDEFEPAVTTKFLTKVTAVRSEMINAVTLRQILDAEDGPNVGAAAEVFDAAEQVRAPQVGRTLATTISAFSAVEAVKQAAPDGKKTWRTHSGHSRPEHSKMNGQSVPVGELFSNGAKWPGDWVLGVDGVAGCQCTVEVSTS